MWGMEASSGVGSCYLMKETPSSLDSGFVFVNVASEIRMQASSLVSFDLRSFHDVRVHCTKCKYTQRVRQPAR